MLNIKPFKQTDDSRCGPACVKMALSYYGIEASEDELCKLCNHTYEYGCDDKGMLNAIHNFGLKTEIKEFCTIDDLKLALNKGFPILVDWFSTDTGHESIVVDVDDVYVTIIDPILGFHRIFPHDLWMQVWFDWRGRNSNFISTWDDMVIRQMIIVKNKDNITNLFN